MYRLTSSDRISVIPHVCNTLELAEIVKNYIESRHNCAIIIEERPGTMCYDCPGSKLINPELYDVEIAFIKVRIDDLGILCAAIARNPAYVFDRGFHRIASFGENICLSELELKECRDFIQANQELIDRWNEEADRIIKNHFTKEKKDAN
jgi:hypothetical protein